MSTTKSDLALRTAAQITVVFVSLYGLTFVNVLRTKARLLRQARKAGTPYDRYTAPGMRTADRLQANFLEWSPIFLGLLWSLAATANLGSSVVAAAWTYVALRVLYVGLILQYGIRSNGLNKMLWASTFPAYGCLTYLTVHAIGALFF
jgi:uncharacterized MAPEG superfamily protein